MKVLVIGAGTMGSGIAQTIAQANNQVYIYDKDQNALNNGMKRIDSSLNKLVVKKKIGDDTKDFIMNQIIKVTDLKDLDKIDLVIEAAKEDIQVKKLIFKELDQIMSESTIFATNTSSLSITEIATVTNRPDKVIGVHFFNPAPIMKLVEVIKGITTSEEVLKEVKRFIKSINKEPVIVQEGPGFVVNRLLIPMINEAAGVYADGIASIEEIDKAMVLGANHPIGPLALADLIGIDIVLAIMENLYSEFSDPKYRPHPILKKMVRGNILGKKTKRGFYTY